MLASRDIILKPKETSENIDRREGIMEDQNNEAKETTVEVEISLFMVLLSLLADGDNPSTELSVPINFMRQIAYLVDRDVGERFVREYFLNEIEKLIME